MYFFMNDLECGRSEDDSLKSHEEQIVEEPVVPPEVSDSLFPYLEMFAHKPAEKRKRVRKKRQPPRIETLPLFSDTDMPLTMNADVPQFEDLHLERMALMSSLEILYKRSGCKPPITLVEHKGCFTNTAMRKTLTKILGGAKYFRKYVLPFTVRPSYRVYPIPKNDKIFILGGSVNDTYDSFGLTFTDRFSLPLLEQVINSNRIRVLGICFGHQSLIEAYGKIIDIPIMTFRDNLQFGFYPVDFIGSHPGLSQLVSPSSKGVAFTRSGYPRRVDLGSASEIPGLNVMAQFTGLLRSTESEKDRAFIPQGVSYISNPDTLNDMVVSFQGHPEIRTTKEHIQPITDFIDSMRDQFLEIIQPMLSFNHLKSNKPKTIADAFFTPLLRHFAEELVNS